jgi:hypothetical protein
MRIPRATPLVSYMIRFAATGVCACGLGASGLSEKGENAE